ncbi:MAG TPA: alpha/beta hydrolase [Anaerolineales bacterium]
MSIPYFTLGESGLPLHFLHANGYPPECYRPLITRLSEHYHVFSMRQRPLWPDSRPEEIADWLPLTDDFLRFLDEHPTGASIGVGHSVGGIVTLRAALRQPERFRALVLIDPVLFPPYVIRSWKIICALGLGYQLHPLVRAARNRRRQFDDLDRLFKGYQRKPVFRYMDDPALHAYVEGIACPGEHGYKLCYNADWEMRIYATSVWRDMDIWRGLPGLNIPLLIIRGAETDTFWASTARRVLRKVPTARVVTVPQATHLVPLERPAEVYQAIQEFLQEIL